MAAGAAGGPVLLGSCDSGRAGAARPGHAGLRPDPRRRRRWRWRWRRPQPRRARGKKAWECRDGWVTPQAGSNQDEQTQEQGCCRQHRQTGPDEVHQLLGIGTDRHQRSRVRRHVAHPVEDGSRPRDGVGHAVDDNGCLRCARGHADVQREGVPGQGCEEERGRGEQRKQPPRRGGRAAPRYESGVHHLAHTRHTGLHTSGVPSEGNRPTPSPGLSQLRGRDFGPADLQTTFT